MNEVTDPQFSYYQRLTARSRLSFLIRRVFVHDLMRHFSGRVLDIGSGIGEFLHLYTDSIGIDRNPYVVAHCVQQGLPCCVGQAYSLPFQSDSFDGVLASNIFEHLHDIESAMGETVRVLKTGGVLVVSVPLEAGFQHDPTHVRMLGRSDLEALAQDSNLRIRTIYRYPLGADWIGKRLYFCELRAVFLKGQE
jgi:SAM-dependent methyltransferase